MRGQPNISLRRDGPRTGFSLDHAPGRAGFCWSLLALIVTCAFLRHGAGVTTGTVPGGRVVTVSGLTTSLHSPGWRGRREGLDLRERTHRTRGLMTRMKRASKPSVDRVKATSDSVEFRRRSLRRRWPGWSYSDRRVGGDDPEVVQALVAGDSLAAVGGGTVPDVHDEGCALPRSTSHQGPACLPVCGKTDCYPAHAVCAAISTAREAGATSADGGHGGSC